MLLLLLPLALAIYGIAAAGETAHILGIETAAAAADAAAAVSYWRCSGLTSQSSHTRVAVRQRLLLLLLQCCSRYGNSKEESAAVAAAAAPGVWAAAAGVGKVVYAPGPTRMLLIGMKMSFTM